MNYEPHGNYLLLRPERSRERSTGGIIIPENYRTNLTQGVIEKIGNEVIHPFLSVGDTVLFKQHSEYRLSLDGEEKILVSESDILMYGKAEGSN